MFDFLGKWLRFSYLRRWLPFTSWDPGLLPCGEAPLCVPSWLFSVWQKILAFGTEKSCLPSRPSLGEILPPIMSQWVPARFQTKRSKRSHCFLIGRGRGSLKFLLVLLSSLVAYVTVALGCNWLQVSTGEMKALQPPLRTFEGKALVTREGWAPHVSSRIHIDSPFLIQPHLPPCRWSEWTEPETQSHATVLVQNCVAFSGVAP